MAKVIDLTGLVFGRLTVLKSAGIIGKSRSIWWICQCECGNTKTIIGLSLRGGVTKSCGCLSIELVKKRSTTHGCGKKGLESPEYIAWRAMIQRVNSKSYHARNRYSKIGITICDRWRYSFENFLSDMGKKHSPKHSLDRYPNKNGNYEHGNCRWATWKEQQGNRTNNKWIEHDGKNMIMSDWARYFGVNPATISELIIKRGFDKVYKYYTEKYANRIVGLP